MRGCVYNLANGLPKFPFATLLSVNDAVKTPPSAALQSKNLFFTVRSILNMLEYQEKVFVCIYALFLRSLWTG